MKLQELLNSDVPYKVLKKTASTFIASAFINGREIRFKASEDHECWDLQFTEGSGPNTTFGKTGSGGEFEVASFVTSAFKELIDLYHPLKITFTADKEQGENRARVYSKILSRVLKGYTREPVPEVWHPGEEPFVYTRNT